MDLYPQPGMYTCAYIVYSHSFKYMLEDDLVPNPEAVRKFRDPDPDEKLQSVRIRYPHTYVDALYIFSEI